MILQLVLTLSLGFGVLSLASIALLNTAGHKLHDIRKVGKKPFNWKDLFNLYISSSDEATMLRKSFARMPIGICWGAAVGIAVLGLIAYFGIDPSTTPKPGEPDSVHLQPYGVVLWASVSVYAGFLVYLTGRISRKFYKILQSVRQH